MRNLVEEAGRMGIAVTYEGADGTCMQVSEETLSQVMAALQGDRLAPPHPPRNNAAGSARCYLPDFLNPGRAWGISLQLYELRSHRNAGIGDFADLAEFCRTAGAMGADFVGCNPLHALFSADPRRCSPFFPSNRRFLNPLYIAIDRVPGISWSADQLQRAEELRNAELVDYESVSRLKRELLRAAWQQWSNAPHLSQAPFAAFRREGGEALRRHACFEALSIYLVERGYPAGWRDWPESYRDCRSPAVASFALAHESEIDFHTWLQWIASRQLKEVRATASCTGMRIGLYLDLAVAEAPDGSATWSDPDRFLSGMKIGAPPDVFSSEGQDWGLAPLSPRLGSESGAALFAKVMQMAGALRIDHAMSLQRLFVIPQDASARHGTYLRYPIDDTLAAIAELSHQHATIVIGEDLGNVPEGFRERMEAAGILSYRVLCFEHADSIFKPASAYPLLSLACATTHDLPPLRAWWNGDDIALRQDQGLIDEEAGDLQQREREVLRQSLRRALEMDAIPPPAEKGDWRSLVLSVHRFIAKTPSLLVAARLADLTGETRPTNIPGTAESYPNWRTKLSLTMEELAGCEMVVAVARILAEERPR